MPQTKARQTARGVVIHEGKVLLIERWRKDAHTGKLLHYLSIPGGGIEHGETAQMAVVRELYEETSLLIRTQRLLATQYFEDGGQNTYFLCTYLSGEPRLHSSAPEKQSNENRSLPLWVSAEEFEKRTLGKVYEPMRKVIADCIKNKPASKPLIL